MNTFNHHCNLNILTSLSNVKNKKKLRPRINNNLLISNSKSEKRLKRYLSGDKKKIC